MKALKNPENGADVTTIVRKEGQSREYSIKVGETLIFDDSVAKDLLTRYQFLEEVEIKQERATGNYKCPHCEYGHVSKIAVLGHMNGHKDLEKKEIIQLGTELPTVTPVEGKPVLSPMEEREIKKREDRGDEIPDRGVDKDGVSWYGPGLEDDDLKKE